jgi:hypothetical protein
MINFVTIHDSFFGRSDPERKLLRDYNGPCRQLAVELPSFLVQLRAARYKQTSSRYIRSVLPILSLSLSLSLKPASPYYIPLAQ